MLLSRDRRLPSLNFGAERAQKLLPIFRRFPAFAKVCPKGAQGAAADAAGTSAEHLGPASLKRPRAPKGDQDGGGAPEVKRVRTKARAAAALLEAATAEIDRALDAEEELERHGVCVEVSRELRLLGGCLEASPLSATPAATPAASAAPSAAGGGGWFLAGAGPSDVSSSDALSCGVVSSPCLPQPPRLTPSKDSGLSGLSCISDFSYNHAPTLTSGAAGPAAPAAAHAGAASSTPLGMASPQVSSCTDACGGSALVGPRNALVHALQLADGAEAAAGTPASPRQPDTAASAPPPAAAAAPQAQPPSLGLWWPVLGAGCGGAPAAASPAAVPVPATSALAPAGESAKGQGCAGGAAAGCHVVPEDFLESMLEGSCDNSFLTLYAVWASGDELV